MDSWLKLVILVVLGGCQTVTDCNHLETRDKVSQVKDTTYDPWSFPKCKKLFEINIK